MAIVRAALDRHEAEQLRRMGNRQVLDLTTAHNDVLTLAFDDDTKLPAWVSWVEANGNLGDVTVRTTYVGYQVASGLLLPSGYNTTIDFRNVVQSKLYVDKYVVDDPTDDLAAPESVRAAAPQVPTPPAVEVVPWPKAFGT